MALNVTASGPFPSPSSPESLPHDNRQGLVVGVTSALLALVVIFMGIRVYIRGFMLKAWAWDDSSYILSGVFIMTLSIPVYFSKDQPTSPVIRDIKAKTSSHLDVEKGSLGLHWWDAAPERLAIDSRFLITTVLTYQIAFASIKATFLLQHRRAFALPSVQLFCDVMLAATAVIMASMLLSGVFVTKKLLDPEYAASSDQSAFLIWGYVNAAVHLATDIIIFILPLPLVGSLKLATMQKAGLIASFAVGIFTGAISVVRMVNLPLGINSTDPFFDAVPLVLFSIAEPTSAIICACIPIMRPLLGCSDRSRNSSHGSRRWLSKLSDKSAGNQTPLSFPEMAYMTPAGSPRGDYAGCLSNSQARELHMIEFGTRTRTPSSPATPLRRYDSDLGP
ncbi:integral membrane protein [Colletotrichum asianum]|uniref:Integral membrane protein n=1 Tax=Colletotrichum asianum TaxID=702518 RepID=A0A8H3ZTF3_9PEZI|nr:integral membrane protein [Colletotrichum asianum]